MRLSIGRFTALLEALDLPPVSHPPKDGVLRKDDVDFYRFALRLLLD